MPIGSALFVLLAAALPRASSTSNLENGAALTGVVISEGKPLEGVIVSAKSFVRPMIVSVVSDGGGRYVFPRTKLPAGKYSLDVRASGYALGTPETVTIMPGIVAEKFLSLRKADDLSNMLTSAEWILSIPGMEKQEFILGRCTQCHTLERVAKSAFNASEFEKVLWRMESHDMPSSDYLKVEGPPGWRWAGPPQDPDRIRYIAEYLAAINLSRSDWDFPYPLRTLPRPTGRGTKVVMTEYKIQLVNARPHDVVMGNDGSIWYSDYVLPQLGRFDPLSGKTDVIGLPVFRNGFAAGSRVMEKDAAGNFWIARYRQAGVTRYNPKTRIARSWSVPSDHLTLDTRVKALAVRGSVRDNKMWFEASSTSCAIARLDLKSEGIEVFELFGPRAKSPRRVRPWEFDVHSTYDIAADSWNNAYFTDQLDSSIGRIDATTGTIEWFPTPTPNAGPRRGFMDTQDRFWFGEFGVNKIGMFDTRTRRFREWNLPTPYTNPYRVVLDKDEQAWAVSKTADRIVRLDVRSDRITEYVLPRSTSANSVYVDDRLTPPTLWLGNLIDGSIVKIEPLD